MGFVAATMGLLLTKITYGFENNDHQQYLLLPYRDIYPHFLPGDWFTWQTTHYHLTFAWLVRALHAISGEALFPDAMLVAHCVTLACVGAGLLAIARGAGMPRTAPWVALLLVVVVRSRGLAGAAIEKGVLLPALLALPAYLLACGAWLKGRFVPTGVWLGVAGFMHPNYAVLGPLSLGPLLLREAQRERSLRPILATAAPFVLLAAPTLYVVVAGFLASDAAPSELSLFFRVRAPHHYDVSRIAWLDVGWVMTLLLLAIPSLVRDEARRLRALLLVLICLLATAWIGGVLELNALVRLFLWRLSVPLCMIAALAFGQALHRALAERDLPRLALSLASLPLLFLYAASNRTLSPTQPLLFAALAPLAIAGAHAAWLRRRWPRVAWLAPALLTAWLGIAIVGHASARDGLPFADAGREMFKLHAVHTRWQPRGEMGALTRWVRARTPPDAHFLVPPGFINFRLHARRAIYVDWKCTPMRGDELAEWKRRMLAAMGTERFPALGYALRHASTRAYARRPAAALARLARQEHLDYVVTSRPRREAELAGLVFVRQFGRWRIFKLRTVE